MMFPFACKSGLGYLPRLLLLGSHSRAGVTKTASFYLQEGTGMAGTGLRPREPMQSKVLLTNKSNSETLYYMRQPDHTSIGVGGSRLFHCNVYNK